MQVKIIKKFEVKEPVKLVWSFLSNPRRVVTCVPGAQITEALDERRYVGTVTVKVGPMISSYKGELVLEVLDNKNYVIELVGKGQDSKGKGSASMKMVARMRALPLGGTEVIGSSELTITGLMAQFGSRVVEEVSNQMFMQFTENIQKKLEGMEGSGSEETSFQPLKAIPLLFTAIKSSTLRLFRRITGRSSET